MTNKPPPLRVSYSCDNYIISSTQGFICWALLHIFPLIKPLPFISDIPSSLLAQHPNIFVFKLSFTESVNVSSDYSYILFHVHPFINQSIILHFVSMAKLSEISFFQSYHPPNFATFHNSLFYAFITLSILLRWQYTSTTHL